MRTFGLIPLIMLVFIGCQEKKGDPQPAPVTPVNGNPIETPTEVAGMNQGKPFKPDKIEFEGRRLKFRSGKDFFADTEIWFDLPQSDDPKLEGKELKYGGDHFGHPMILVSFKDADNFPKSDFVWPKDYTMTLKFTKHTAKMLEGTIDLRFVKPGNSHLKGTFAATIVKTGAEALSVDDAPYIHGKIAIVGEGAWKNESFTAGFIGKGTDGKNTSNLAGTSFSSGGSESATTTSFRPQLTSIFNHPMNGLRFKHVKIAPGEYLVYVRRADVMAAWKKVAVKAGDELTVDLNIDPALSGSLVITLPDEEANDKNESPLSLVPLELDSSDYSIRYAFKAADVKTGTKTVAVKGMPAGKYRAVRGKCEATVEVTAGKESAATLASSAMKK